MLLKTLNNQRWKHIDLVVFTLITTLSIASGKTTIFYILYLFWWSEFVRKAVGYWYLKNQNMATANKPNTYKMGSFFLLFIYFVFIVVFFGLMANWGNTEVMIINTQLFFFKNWFFNVNLIWIIGENIWINKKGRVQPSDLSPFSANAIVMHLSIILGGLLMFFVVKQFPFFFTPESFWGSVLIVSPFLLLRLIAEVYFRKDVAATTTK